MIQCGLENAVHNSLHSFGIGRLAVNPSLRISLSIFFLNVVPQVMWVAILYLYNFKPFECRIHNRWLFVMEDKWGRPDFSITCQIYPGEGLGNGSITQLTKFFNVFCDDFAGNTKIQANV